MYLCMYLCVYVCDRMTSKAGVSSKQALRLSDMAQEWAQAGGDDFSLSPLTYVTKVCALV
jgi:hypothetical protein